MLHMLNILDRMAAKRANPPGAVVLFMGVTGDRCTIHLDMLNAHNPRRNDNVSFNIHI